MNKPYCLIIMFLTCRICNAQNLVPNGDFETYVNCPTGHSIACVPFIDNLDSATGNWHNIGCASADYFNACNNSIGGEVGVPQNSYSYQYSRSGVGQMGLWLITPGLWMEYGGTYLTSPLIANQTYYVEFYANLENRLTFITDSSDALGALFTIGEPDTTGFTFQGLTSYTAQINNPDGNFISDTLNWEKISGTFVATGGEDFITIGNFKDTASTHGHGYYFIDDVFVTTSTGINNVNQNVSVSIYPAVFSNNLNIKISSNHLSEIILFDITSRKMLQKEFTNSTLLNTESLAKGIYLYEVRNKNGMIKKGKVVKE